MPIRNPLYYIAILALLVSAPMLAAESISQIQSLEGQVRVQRGNETLAVSSESEIYSDDLISTSESGRLATLLWSQVNLKLEPSSEIVVISNTNNSSRDASVVLKMIKLAHGASCIEIEHLMSSPVFFQLGDRVTIKFIKPVALCLSTDLKKSHIQLVKGSAELMHLSDSMLIALNEPGSEINFFDGGIFSLGSPSSASPQVISTQDSKQFFKTEEDLKKLPETAGLKESSSTADPKVPSKIEIPVVLPKVEGSETLSKTDGPKERLGTADSTESSKTVDMKLPSETAVPVATSKPEDPKQLPKTVDTSPPPEITVPIALSEPEDSKERSNNEEVAASTKTGVPEVPSKIAVPIALSETENSNQPAKSDDFSKTQNTKELYNVYLHKSRAYEATAAINRQLQDSGYSSIVIDEIDNKGPLFTISVPNFETVTAARGFIEKVVVGLGIHDAWIERHQVSKAEMLNESSKTAARKASAKNEVPIALAETEVVKASPKTMAPKSPSKVAVPVALSKTENSNQPANSNDSSKTRNTKELYNVYLHKSRAYEATAAINRQLQDSGYSSIVIDEIDNKGPLFTISVPNFETVTAARGFIEKVVVGLGIHDAWIERHQVSKAEMLNESSKTAARKASAKNEVPIALAETEVVKASPKTMAPKSPSKVAVPVALSKTENSNQPANSNDSSKTRNTKELYNVYLHKSRAYEATAAINRQLRDLGYASTVIDEIDNQGPLFTISVPNFETVAAAREFVEKVVVNLGIHDAWIARQQSKK